MISATLTRLWTIVRTILAEGRNLIFEKLIDDPLAGVVERVEAIVVRNQPMHMFVFSIVVNR